MKIGAAERELSSNAYLLGSRGTIGGVVGAKGRPVGEGEASSTTEDVSVLNTRLMRPRGRIGAAKRESSNDAYLLGCSRRLRSCQRLGSSTWESKSLRDDGGSLDPRHLPHEALKDNGRLVNSEAAD